MTVRFTREILSLFFISFFWVFASTSQLNAQTCANPVGTSVSNLSNFSATFNWTLDTTVHHYRVRYKRLGSNSWLFKNGLTTSTTDVVNLLANTNYVWQARAYCSSGNTNSSGWSVLDTFLTMNYPVDCYNTPNGLSLIHI